MPRGIVDLGADVICWPSVASLVLQDHPQRAKKNHPCPARDQNADVLAGSGEGGARTAFSPRQRSRTENMPRLGRGAEAADMKTQAQKSRNLMSMEHRHDNPQTVLRHD